MYEHARQNKNIWLAAYRLENEYYINENKNYSSHLLGLVRHIEENPY